MSALDYVIDSARQEVARIDGLIENILVTEGPESELLMDLYDRQVSRWRCLCASCVFIVLVSMTHHHHLLQDELDPSTFETRASTILVGLGFKVTAVVVVACTYSTIINIVTIINIIYITIVVIINIIIIIISIIVIIVCIITIIKS